MLRSEAFQRFTARAWLPLGAAAILSACTGAPVKPEVPPGPSMADLQGQIRAQSALVSDQQRRIEDLELKLSALSAKLSAKDKAAAKVAAEKSENPAIEYDGEGKQKGQGEADPRRKLETVKLEPQKPAKGRSVRRNPVERAPKLPTITNLKDPDQTELARLEEPAPTRRAAADPELADRAFARAVQRLNDGDRAGARIDLLSFARANPRHAAADNAVYLAGLAVAQGGDCSSALPLFARVEQEYPQGDAVPQARLEEARCLLKLGRADEAKEKLGSLEKDHPDVPEASQARALLNGLY